MPTSKLYKSAVIGSGPAGVALVGKLCDIKATPILWIDPFFRGGRLHKYTQVPSNTKVGLFVKFSETFESFNSNAAHELKKLDQDQCCQLKFAHQMMIDLTKGLQDMKEVEAKEATVNSISRKDTNWHLETDYGNFDAKNVFLATGSHPKTLQCPENCTEIHLDDALSPDLLKTLVQSGDRVAVVGSSHSAILVLRNLSEIPGIEVKNFYRDELKYAEYKTDYILYDNTGLKGDTAKWAKHELENVQNISRFHESEYENGVKDCNKIIFAIGFERNDLPVEGNITYNETNGQLWQNGCLMEGMFGFGIAFPEKVVDPESNVEFSVGMWKFVRYIRDCLDLEKLQ